MSLPHSHFFLCGTNGAHNRRGIGILSKSSAAATQIERENPVNRTALQQSQWVREFFAAGSVHQLIQGQVYDGATFQEKGRFSRRSAGITRAPRAHPDDAGIGLQRRDRGAGATRHSSDGAPEAALASASRSSAHERDRPHDRGLTLETAANASGGGV